MKGRKLFPQSRKDAKKSPTRIRQALRLCAFAGKTSLAPLRQRRPRHFLVVEMKNFAPDDLIILVSLARDQHQIPIARFGDCLIDRCGAIRELAIRLAGLLNYLLRVAKNLLRIFGARIVGSQDHHVTQTPRPFAHRRPPRTISIAPTTKHGDDLSLHHLAGRAQHVQQRVVAVRVIDYHREITVMDHALKTSGRACAFLERGSDDIETVAERESTPDSRERVVNVRWTNESRMKIAFARGCDESKAHTVQRELRVASDDLAIASDRVTNHVEAIVLQ